MGLFDGGDDLKAQIKVVFLHFIMLTIWLRSPGARSSTTGDAAGAASADTGKRADAAEYSTSGTYIVSLPTDSGHDCGPTRDQPSSQDIL